MPKHVTESVAATMTAQHDFGSTSVGLKTDLIEESTAAAGVSIDQVLCKDAAVTASGGVTADVTGNVTGDVTADTVTVSSTFEPASDDAVDLGSSSKQFKDAYIDGKLYTDAIDLNGTAITATGAELNIMAGVTATASELNQCDGVGLLVGDTTSGRILRLVYLNITDATDANEIKCTVTNRWNGDAIEATDNIGKGETVGNFTLDASGYSLTIKAAGLTGNCVAVVTADIVKNVSANPLNVSYQASGNDIVLLFTDDAGGGIQDLTSSVDTGNVELQIAYITDA